MTNDEIDFSAALENYLEQHDYNTPEAGDIRTGVIVDISSEGMIIDLGLKRDGFVPAADLAKLSEKERAELAIEQEIPVYIVSTGDSLQISVHRAYLNEDWIQAQKLLDEGTIVEAEVVGYNRGGALVEFGRLRGFIPLSQLSEFRPGMQDRDKQRMLSKLRNRQLPLKIIEVDRRRRRLVMSNRDAQREWDTSRRTERLKELKSSDVLQGRVSSLRDFGAFVDLGDGLEGLVHVSELAWYRIDHPSEVIKVGDEIEVYVLKVDREQQRISLSRKRLLPDPWSLVNEKYEVGQLVEGKITRIVNYGAFVEIEPGIEGLLHASKLARSEVSNPEEVVREGENHLLRIISIDTDRQRIGLSLRAVTQQEQIDWMMQQESGQVEDETQEPPLESESEAEEAGPEVAETEEATSELEAVEETAEETAAAEIETEETTSEAETAEETAAVEETDEATTSEADLAEEETAAVEETNETTAEEIVAVVEAETMDSSEETNDSEAVEAEDSSVAEAETGETPVTESSEADDMEETEDDTVEDNDSDEEEETE